ncbi:MULTISPECIES: major capsid protein [unclassified Capnocytophaga]|uniref:major capsid protein n=1 Tax=unclassified Capnocytophaga TaxID=2640652 RepID=UPI0002E13D87|nr:MULTISPECIES: major capsid protein [unclassified Capnocytophaga]MEB3004648.1 major capsid protein [Capnocytophaga sp. G2]
MNTSLMIGLNQTDLQAVVRSYSLENYYYPTLFPLRETSLLSWRMLQAQAGLKIAGDLIARGASIPKKVRKAIARIGGDIPKISIAREKNEDDLTEYDLMVAAAAQNADLTTLVEFWADDTQYCWQGIASRAEWIALQQISLGKVVLSPENNFSVVSQYNVDYQIPSEQKIGVEAPYNGTNGKPLSKDIPRALRIGKEKHGVTYKYAFMNADTFLKFSSQEEVIKKCASYSLSLTGLSDTPDLLSVNAYLAKHTETYRGLQIIVIDQEITLEQANGNAKTSNPFADNVILFSESKVLGATYWKAPIDLKMQGSNALKVLHGHTLIKKYSEESPVREVTEAVANLFPAWNLASRSTLMQVDNTSWRIN